MTQFFKFGIDTVFHISMCRPVNHNSLLDFALTRGGSRTAATSNTKLFVIIANGLQPLTIIIKCSILDVATVLDPPLLTGSSTLLMLLILLLPLLFSLLMLISLLPFPVT